MMNYPVALVYLGFFVMIAFAVWYTNEPWCLLALFLLPQYHDGPGAKDE